MKISFIYRKISQDQGFTLLELMIVMLFMSIFAAVALPNFLKQVGKAREVEFKNTVGTVNRSQQAYHWEKNLFAQGDDDLASLELLGIRLDREYTTDYNINAHSGSIDYATIAPSNTNYQNDQTRAYSGLTMFDDGNYEAFMCQSLLPAEETAPPILPPDTPCALDAEQIR
jgi:prepilin-type N-terminal cleavage/methylation domain-containing protein